MKPAKQSNSKPTTLPTTPPAMAAVGLDFLEEEEPDGVAEDEGAADAVWLLAKELNRV